MSKIPSLAAFNDFCHRHVHHWIGLAVVTAAVDSSAAAIENHAYVADRDCGCMNSCLNRVYAANGRNLAVEMDVVASVAVAPCRGLDGTDLLIVRDPALIFSPRLDLHPANDLFPAAASRYQLCDVHCHCDRRVHYFLPVIDLSLPALPEVCANDQRWFLHRLSGYDTHC